MLCLDDKNSFFHYYFIMRQKQAGLFFVLFACISLSAGAQLFNPFTSLRVIKTEYFDIIFPAESESSARLLASYADSVYEYVSSLLGIDVPVRIPVTFAPHTDLFNGYYNSISSPHIVLYDTPMDLEWTSFANTLEGLFIHELAHAVSLNTRSPFYRTFQRIFGNWVSPAFITAPLFMVEGVTISFESLSGFGRANDPLVKQRLRQAIHENRFPTPFQVSGVYDYPGQRGNWYDYGGLFSAWLIENYGMEKYAGLWQAMGSISRFSFSVYRSGYYRTFKNVYGIDFIDVWKTFSESLALYNLEENDYELLPVRRHFFSERRNSISALAAGENFVYILDSTEEIVRVYDMQTGKTRNININSFFSYDLDVSADEAFLLLSGYHRTGERYRAVVTEYETASGRKTGRTIQGLFKARYFRDGVIGIRSELHNTCIVYEDFNGNREILFRGNEKLLFSGPQVLDNERIVFIAARNGVRELLLYNFVSGELFRIESYIDNDYCSNVWRYMRSLGVSEGKLFFSHNPDDRMYKLGVIDLETMQAVLSSRDFSGGISYPVSVKNNVYYRGAFFSGDGFLRFPETVCSLSGMQIDIKLTELNNENYGMAIMLNTEKSAVSAGLPWLGDSRPYRSISYMNPFNFWLPLPLIRYSISLDNFDFNLDGAGLISVITDPTDRHLIMFTAYADITYRMAMIEDFTWQNTIAGFPLTVEFSDMVIANSGNNPYRDTRVSLSGSFTEYSGRWAYGISVGAGYVRLAFSDGRQSAYQWQETTSAFFYSTGLLFSSLRRRQNELFGTGLSVNLRGISIVENFRPRVEGIFRASAETRFPVNFTLYGAYDDIGMNIYGASRTYGQPVFARASSREYPLPSGLSLSWIGGGELSIGLFSFEIQRNLSHVYFNRFFGALTLRSVIFDSKGNEETEGVEIGDIRLAQSLVLRFGMLSSVIPIKLNPFFIEPNIWGAWKFSNTITGKGYPWGFGFGVNLRY